MKSVGTRTLLILVAALTLLAVAGCARKSTQTAPTVATPPPAGSPTDSRTNGSGSGAGGSTTTTDPAPATDVAPVFFGYDSHSLDAAARAVLDRNARVMRENTSLRVTIEGHCDERGTAEYNMALGELRARAARTYLVNAGVAASRLEVISYGKERPFEEGQNEAAWAQNRRAHFVTR